MRQRFAMTKFVLMESQEEADPEKKTKIMTCSEEFSDKMTTLGFWHQTMWITIALLAFYFISIQAEAFMALAREMKRASKIEEEALLQIEAIKHNITFRI